MSKLFTKDPNETQDVTIDWDDFIDDTGSPTDAILTSTWTLPSTSPEEIVLESEHTLGTLAVAFLSGGKTGEVYRLLNSITTVGGRSPERVIFVHIVDSTEGAFLSQLVAEDGSVVTGANAYITREECSAYHAVRQNTAWFEATAPNMDAAIVKATSDLVQKYRKRWKGIRVSNVQTLDWPRAGVQTEDLFEPQTEPRSILFTGLANLIAENIVPQEVKDSTAELALTALTTTLNPDLDRGGDIKRVKAGSVEVEYGNSASATTERPAVDGLLSVLLESTNTVARG